VALLCKFPPLHVIIFARRMSKVLIAIDISRAYTGSAVDKPKESVAWHEYGKCKTPTTDDRHIGASKWHESHRVYKTNVSDSVRLSRRL